MNTYLVVYDVDYRSEHIPEEYVEEQKQIREVKDRWLLESIHSHSQHINKKIFSQNLVVESDRKGKKLLDFVIERIKEEWPLAEGKWHEISILNIINLDEV